MKALQSLTALFTAQVVNSENIYIWAEKGRLMNTQGRSIDGFNIAYSVTINMTNVAIAPQILMMHLVNWLNKYDVSRNEKGLAPPSFETAILDNGCCDIKLTIDIQEAYSLHEDAKGNWKGGDGTRYTCDSDFTSALDEDDLPKLLFVGDIDHHDESQKGPQ